MDTDFQEVAEIKTIYISNVELSQRPKLLSSKDAFNHLLKVPNFVENLDYIECFYVIYLTRGNNVICVKLISQGGTEGTVVDPKIIFQNALKINAHSMILSHNHPSGEVRPSESDIRLTKKVREGGKFLDIPVLDHLIISREKYFSFADEGKLA